MVSTFLVIHPWITTVALLGLLTLGPAVGLWLVTRPRLAVALGVLSLAPVALLTLVPTDRDLAVTCAAEWSVPTLGAVELMANVVLFVPPALLLGIGLRRPVAVLVSASGVSAALETTQALVTALGRSCSTNDWLANSLGAALGAAIAFGVLAAANRRNGVQDTHRATVPYDADAPEPCRD